MHSLVPLLLAARLLQIPFGSSLVARLPASTQVPPTGRVVGQLLVTDSREAADGEHLVTLRPLALGEVEVPFAGARPARVEVAGALPADAVPRPLEMPAPPPFPWGTIAAPLAAVLAALLAARALRHRRPADPVKALQAALRALTEPAGWTEEGAADRLSRGCRGFLQALTAAPCGAMTTRELGHLLGDRLAPRHGAPFAAALALADESRFAGARPPVGDAVEVVRRLLSTAPEVQAAVRGEG